MAPGSEAINNSNASCSFQTDKDQSKEQISTGFRSPKNDGNPQNNNPSGILKRKSQEVGVPIPAVDDKMVNMPT